MRVSFVSSCLIWSFLSLAAMGQFPTLEAQRHGMELAWQSQVQLPLDKELVSAQLVSYADGARKYVEVTVPGLSKPIRKFVDAIGRSGEPVGVEGAKKLAIQEALFYTWDTDRDGSISVAEGSQLGKGFAAVDRDRTGKVTYAEYAQFLNWTLLVEQTLGKADLNRMLRDRGLQNFMQATTSGAGLEAKEGELPSLKLVIATRSGLVTCFDAETGKTDWATHCDSTEAPAYATAVNTSKVAMIQNGKLYLLELSDGSQAVLNDGSQSPFTLPNPTSNAVALTKDAAFVTDRAGRVLSYAIGSKEFKQPFGYALHGAANENTLSILDKDLCAIASDRGYLYVFNSIDRPTVLWRYESSTPVRNCLASANGAFYVGTEGGKFSKMIVEARDGRILYEFLASEPLTSRPLIHGSTAYFAADTGTLFSVDDKTGSQNWVSRSIAVQYPMAVIGNILVCTTRGGGIAGFDVANGHMQFSRRLSEPLGQVVSNQLTDRLYLVGASGHVLCLRPVGGEAPKMVVPVTDKPEEPKDTSPFSVPESEPTMDAGGDDPFATDPAMEGGEADPFAAPE